MKKALNTLFIIILVILMSSFGAACKNEVPVEKSAEEATEVPADEVVEQAQESTEEETAEEATTEEAPEEATDEEVEVMQYSIDSKMEDLLDNPQTREILEKFIPDIINSDRIDESLGYALSLVLRFSDVDEDIIPLLDEALKNVGSESADVVETVNYNFKFDATWSNDSHPDDYVSSAHFSPFVVYSYNGTDQGRIFTTDSISTSGMEEMAETGATGILEEEINQIIDSSNALNYAKAVKIDSPGQTEKILEFTQEFSQFIFVTMIAPSPDWFVAGEADLFIDGQWVDKMILDVISFDAGTDSGDSLTAANSDTDPKQPINRFDDSLQKLGTITITKN
ncbi:MAG: spondin domain-containing protein [Candidatus Humimicrobiaceae bacterium]